MQLEKLPNRTVIWLMTPANQPCPNISSRQSLELPQRPLLQQHAVDDQSDHHARVKRSPSLILVDLDELTKIGLLQFLSKLHDPTRADLREVLIQPLATDEDPLGVLVLKLRHLLAAGQLSRLRLPANKQLTLTGVGQSSFRSACSHPSL